MKKDFLWMLGVLIAMLFASCGSESGNLQKGPGITVTAIADTSIIVETPLTVPRYACGSGKRLTHDKYLGSDPKLVSVADTESVFLSDDSLNEIGYIYMPGIEPTVETTEPSFSVPTPISSSWGWLEDFASFLLAILMFAIVAWILWWLLNQQPWKARGVTPVTSAAPGAAAAVNTGSGGNPNPSPTPASTSTPVSSGHQEIVTHLQSLMKTMQETGTTELDYRTNGHELHLKNSGKKPAEKEKKTETEKSAPSDQATDNKEDKK
ncbi:MAG: hypothetical protein QG563_152 [Patescibacteria group bacterium]|nr:hypothetical protein [Patescibacteria group bacterium]